MSLRSIACVLIVILGLGIVLSGCGDNKVINGVEYGRYGLLNADDKKNPDIQYEMIWGNLVWGTILFPTMIGPIYFFGFDLFEPVGLKPAVKGQVTR